MKNPQFQNLAANLKFFRSWAGTLLNSVESSATQFSVSKFGNFRKLDFLRVLTFLLHENNK